MKINNIIWIMMFLLVSYSMYAQLDDQGIESLEDNYYLEYLNNNQDFEISSGDEIILTESYTGAVSFNSIESATVILANGHAVEISGTGTCNANGCTILDGEIGEGPRTLSNGQFRIKNDGSIDLLTRATIGEGNLAVDAFSISNIVFNGDGTFSFDVEEDSEIAGIVFGGEGRVEFDPEINSIKPSIDDPEEDSVFVIKSIDIIAEPITFIRDNVNIGSGDGMYLTTGSAKIVFNEEDCVGNCVFLSTTEERIVMKGEDYTIRFDENNDIVNAYPQDELREEYEEQKREFFDYELMQNIKSKLKGASVLEFSPRKTATIEIENRNVNDPGGVLGISEEDSQAPKITVTGDEFEEVWAVIKSDGVTLDAGRSGIINSRLPLRGDSELGIPIELNIVDGDGRSLIKDKLGREIKASLGYFGSVEFSSTNAKTNIEGHPYCDSSSSSITGNTIREITGRSLIIVSTSEVSPPCEANYFYFGREFASKSAVDAAKEEYELNLGKAHDFEPEYSQNLGNIALYIRQGLQDVIDTQVEIMQQLPEYTEIKLFIESEEQMDYFETVLSPDIYERITFLVSTSDYRINVWAQDYSMGDSDVQILPLTYLGGGQRNAPGIPKNEFIYQLEDTGIEIRKIPVEFGGGNVFVTEDQEGEKILLIGGNSYLETVKTYKLIGETISEDEYKEILRESFHVDEVEIVATRDDLGQVERQHSKVFHIDQIMLPVDDGVVAMPTIVDLIEPAITEEEIDSLKISAMNELAERFNLPQVHHKHKRLSYTDEFDELSAEHQEQIREEQDKIIRSSYSQRDILYNYQMALGVNEQLKENRRQMESLGFEIIDLKADPSSVGDYQAYTNGLVYTDRDTGQKTVIMPIFPNEEGEYLMEGLNLENKQAFEAAGFKVSTVRDRAFQWQGNLHCITTLAQAPQNPSSCQIG